MKLSFVSEQTTQAFRAGGELTGKLIIDPTSSSNKPVRASSLALYFRGKEYTKVEYKETEGRGKNKRTTHKTAQDKHEFVHMDIPVPNASSIVQYGRVVPGLHEVPFSITLPSHIPSSVFVSKGGESATIAYCLRAKLRGSGRLRDYQARQPVQVIARAMEPAAFHSTLPRTVPPVTKDINTLKIFGKGDISYGAKLESTRLVPGQQAQVKMALLNNSQARIEHVKVEPREMVQWSARGYKADFTRSPCVERYQEAHFCKSQKVDKQSLKQAEQDMCNQPPHDQIRDALLDNNNNNNSGGDNMLVASLCTLPPIPHRFVHETFQGSMIEVTHDIRVKIKTMALTTNPEFTAPIEIVQGGLSEGAATAAIPFQYVEAEEIPMATAVEPINATANNFFTGDAAAASSSDLYPPSINPEYIHVVSKPPPPLNPTFYDVYDN